MKEVMNNILTRLIREDRPVRFEVRHMGWTNRYAVTYRFADEDGIRRTIVDDLFRDDAERIADEGNVALGGLLASPTYSF